MLVAAHEIRQLGALVRAFKSANYAGAGLDRQEVSVLVLQAQGLCSLRREGETRAVQCPAVCA